MRRKTDHVVAALATAAQVKYWTARDALYWCDLPGHIENSVYGNPESVKKAIEKLGLTAIRRTLKHISMGAAPVNRTMILLHEKVGNRLVKWWTVLHKATPQCISVHYGYGAPKVYRQREFQALFTRGLRPTAYELYRKPRPNSGMANGVVQMAKRLFGW